MWKTWVQSLGREDTLEKETATHSSFMAWKILADYSPKGRTGLKKNSKGHILFHVWVCSCFLVALSWSIALLHAESSELGVEVMEVF